MSYSKYATRFEDIFGKVAIIRDDSRFLSLKEANDFYEELKKYIEKRGFRVEYAPIDSFTLPNKDAVLWIGHGKGNRKLKRAPENVRILAFGSNKDYAINHPIEEKMFNCYENEMGKAFLSFPIKEHFAFTREMQEEINQVLKEIKANVEGFKYYKFRGIDYKEQKQDKFKFIRRFFR